MIGLRWRGGGVQKACVPPQPAVGDRHVRTRLRMRPGRQVYTVQCRRCLTCWHHWVSSNNNDEVSRTLGVLLAPSALGRGQRPPTSLPLTTQGEDAAPFLGLYCK